MLAALGPNTNFYGREFYSCTMTEIRAAVTAVRMERNDLSLTGAYHALIYINSNRGKEDEALTDVSSFLPHPSEYMEAQDSQQLKLRPYTARLLLEYRGYFDSRIKAIMSIHDKVIEKVAAS